jgi:hypothetical protein
MIPSKKVPVKIIVDVHERRSPVRGGYRANPAVVR